MAPFGTSFKRSRAGDFNIFDVLDESDDTTNSSPISIVCHKPPTALSEVEGNSIHGHSRISPDDLAFQLENLHLATPVKINKTRGLRPRPTIGLSTFDFPAEEQENSDLVSEGGGAVPSDTASEAAEVGSLTPNLLALRDGNNNLPSDSAQLAKHQAGEFEYVLSLPAVTTLDVNTTTNEISSATIRRAQQEVTTVQFGCNLIRADGTSDLARRNESDYGNRYTLLATPIESDDKIIAKPLESIAETVEDMATATVTKVSEIPTLSQQGDETAITGEQSPRTRIESLLGIGEPSKAGPLAQVAEIPVAHVPVFEIPLLSRENDEPESKGDERLPGLVSVTTGEGGSVHGNESENSGGHGSRRASDVSTSRPLQHDNHHGHQLGAIRNHTPRRSPSVLSDDKDDVIDEIMSLPPAPSPSSRIADSVEALDKLEEQLEALNEVERVLSAEAARVPRASTKPSTGSKAAKRAQPEAAKSNTRPAAGTVGSKTAGRGASVRHSIAVPPSKQTEQNSAVQAAASKRLSVVSRPASLAPPKPLVRSSKPPTTSTFELPGEAVAQRLKEKRLARMSMSLPASGQTAGGRTSSPTKSKTATSTKPPTRPNFELPGEAISRRKREEREAKLKEEQEEERKRREFKARPVRASVVAGGTFPRQTAASRARMSLKAGSSAAEVPAADAASTTATGVARHGASKRYSTVGAGMSGRPSLAVSTGGAASRGRGSVALSPSTAGISRATSTSGGSARGSSLSAEEMQQQKLRGKEIFKRESSFVSEKERERRSREEAARKAREEAAERSRKAGREWAEKQKARKMATVGGSPSFAA